MTIKEERKVLGIDANNLRAEEIQQYIDSASLLANIALDTLSKMSPKKREEDS